MISKTVPVKGNSEILSFFSISSLIGQYLNYIISLNGSGYK